MRMGGLAGAPADLPGPRLWGQEQGKSSAGGGLHGLSPLLYSLALLMTGSVTEPVMESLCASVSSSFQ